MSGNGGREGRARQRPRMRQNLLFSLKDHGGSQLFRSSRGRGQAASLYFSWGERKQQIQSRFPSLSPPRLSITVVKQLTDQKHNHVQM